MRDGKLDRPREPTPEPFGTETAAGPWLEGRREDLDRALGGQAGEQRLASRVEALPRHELAGKHEIVDPGAAGREPPEDPLVKRVMDVVSGHALPVERGDKLGRTGDHEIQIGKRIRQIEGAANRLKGEAQPGDLVAESAHQIAIIGVEPHDLWPERASLGEEDVAGPGAFGDIDPVLAGPRPAGGARSWRPPRRSRTREVRGLRSRNRKFRRRPRSTDHAGDRSSSAAASGCCREKWRR